MKNEFLPINLFSFFGIFFSVDKMLQITQIIASKFPEWGKFVFYLKMYFETRTLQSFENVYNANHERCSEL